VGFIDPLEELAGTLGALEVDTTWFFSERDVASTRDLVQSHRKHSGAMLR